MQIIFFESAFGLYLTCIPCLILQKMIGEPFLWDQQFQRYVKSREGIKNKMILLFFNLVGPIFLLSAEKRTERSNVYGRQETHVQVVFYMLIM